MNKLQKRRLWYVGLSAITLSLAATLILYALKQNINAFYTPSDLSIANTPLHRTLRLGGMVKKQSIAHDATGLGVHFIVTDFKREIPVDYVGILPDLFHEEKGVIVEGQFDAQHLFIAHQVLAKHDENYMPKDVYKKLRDKTA